MARLRMLRPQLATVEVRKVLPMTFDQVRGSAASRGYDAAWRRLRLQVLADEPLCRFCAAKGLTVAAVDVDHVQTIADRPDLRLVRSNLRPLCSSCHSIRTQRHEAEKRRRG